MIFPLAFSNSSSPSLAYVTDKIDRSNKSIFIVIEIPSVKQASRQIFIQREMSGGGNHHGFLPG